MNGTRLGLYDYLNKRGFTKDRKGNLNFFKSGLVASFSGAIGAAVGSPFFLVANFFSKQISEAGMMILNV